MDKLHMSFPKSEINALKQRLSSGKSIYTTRVSTEMGKYLQGNIVDSVLGDLRVDSIQKIQGLRNHPFYKELTSANKKALRGRPMELLRLKTATDSTIKNPTVSAPATQEDQAHYNNVRNLVQKFAPMSGVNADEVKVEAKTLHTPKGMVFTKNPKVEAVEFMEHNYMHPGFIPSMAPKSKPDTATHADIKAYLGAPNYENLSSVDKQRFPTLDAFKKGLRQLYLENSGYNPSHKLYFNRIGPDVREKILPHLPPRMQALFANYPKEAIPAIVAHELGHASKDNPWGRANITAHLPLPLRRALQRRAHHGPGRMLDESYANYNAIKVLLQDNPMNILSTQRLWNPVVDSQLSYLKQLLAKPVGKALYAYRSATTPEGKKKAVQQGSDALSGAFYPYGNFSRAVMPDDVYKQVYPNGVPRRKYRELVNGQ